MPTRKNTTTTARRAIGYVRISKDRQEETSTTTQAERIRAYCQAHGIQLVDVITEPGRSAYKASRSTRPGLRKALRLIQTGAANTFVVWKLDRCARNTRDLLDFVHQLEGHGATFTSVTESFDTGIAIGRTMMTLVAALAELESAQKSERTEAWQDYRRTTGAVPTGPRPYGYRRSRNALTIVEEEAVVIRDAASAILAGVSLRSLTARLNAAGGRSDGRPLTSRGLMRMLTGPTIAGLRAVDGTFMASDAWQPILDRKTWEQVRAILTDPARRTTPGNERRWLLSGLIECDRCDGGTAIRAKPHRFGPRYSCPKCHLSIGAVATDDLVERDVLGLLDARAWKRLRRRGHRHTDTSTLEAELEELAHQRADGDITAAEWKVLREGLIRRLADAAAEPLGLPDVADLRKAWPDLTVEERRLIITAVVARIRVLPAGENAAPRFDEQRVSLAWSQLDEPLASVA